MRLVDTDNLELQEYEPQNDLAYAAGWNDCVDTIRVDICDMPTIDAIPVEWLKQQFYDNPNSQWAEKCRDVFTGWQKWQRMQKEQEVQDG